MTVEKKSGWTGFPTSPNEFTCICNLYILCIFLYIYYILNYILYILIDNGLSQIGSGWVKPQLSPQGFRHFKIGLRLQDKNRALVLWTGPGQAPLSKGRIDSPSNNLLTVLLILVKKKKKKRVSEKVHACFDIWILYLSITGGCKLCACTFPIIIMSSSSNALSHVLGAGFANFDFPFIDIK